MNNLGKNRIPFLFIIDFNLTEAFVLPVHEIDTDKVKFSFHSDISNPEKEIKFKIFPPLFKEFEIAYGKVKNEINAGNTYLLNLTFSSKISGNFNLKDVYNSAKANYKLYVKDKFTVFSPETFVKIIDGKIFSYPMKGTIDAGIPNAEKIILNDKKETAEHYTIVDLIRNDLNSVAKKIKVENFRYVDKIKTNRKNLLQISSKISGELAENYTAQIGTIFGKLLPAGSISGAPKKKTVKIIKDVEIHKREFYTGVAGFFDGHNLDSFVMIRFIEKNDAGYVYKSGGGITFMSDALSEYNELKDKIYLPL